MSPSGIMHICVPFASMRLQLGVDGVIKRRCILPRDLLRPIAGMLRLLTAVRDDPPHDPNEVRGRLGVGTPGAAARTVRRLHDDLRREEDRHAVPREAPVELRPRRLGGRPLAPRVEARFATTSSLGVAIVGAAASSHTTSSTSFRFQRSPGFASTMRRALAQGATSAPTSISSPVPQPRARMSPLLRPLSLPRVQGGLTGGLTARRPPLRIFDRGGPQPSGFNSASF